jgi:hypothetical protein
VRSSKGPPNSVGAQEKQSAHRKQWGGAMKPAIAFASIAAVFTFGCTRPQSDWLTPAPSSSSVLRADRLHKMPGATALDALETMSSYFGRTTRQPAPRFILILDGTRTSNLEMLKGIQAGDVYEIRVIGESQSVGNQGEVEIVVTTIAGRARIG